MCPDAPNAGDVRGILGDPRNDAIFNFLSLSSLNIVKTTI